jgi:MFS family permease
VSEHNYLPILRRRGMVGLLTAAMIGRLASGMVPFGAVAVFTERNQPTNAGLAFAVFLIFAAGSGPWRGRLVDRHGARSVLPALAALFAVAVCAAALSAAVPPICLAALAAAACLVPPAGATLRTVWTTIAASPQENRALHSLDSVCEEITFVISPLVTAAVWAILSPEWALAAGAGTAVIGTGLLLASARRAGTGVWRVFNPAPKPDTAAGPPASGRSLLIQRNGIALLAPMVGLGVVMGTVGVAIPTWAAARYTAELSGVVLSAISAAGVLAGLAFGKLTITAPRRTQYTAVGILTAAGAGVLALSDTLPAGIVAAALIGAGMTPMFIIAYLYVSDTVPAGRHTEANAGLGSAYNIGSGAAAAATGALLTATSTTLTLTAAALATVTLSFCALLAKPLPAAANQPSHQTAGTSA